jgi:hypothetical protein
MEVAGWRRIANWKLSSRDGGIHRVAPDKRERFTG